MIPYVLINVYTITALPFLPPPSLFVLFILQRTLGSCYLFLMFDKFCFGHWVILYPVTF